MGSKPIKRLPDYSIQDLMPSINKHIHKAAGDNGYGDVLIEIRGGEIHITSKNLDREIIRLKKQAHDG